MTKARRAVRAVRVARRGNASAAVIAKLGAERRAPGIIGVTVDLLAGLLTTSIVVVAVGTIASKIFARGLEELLGATSITLITEHGIGPETGLYVS
jgi:hypothetical protein